MGHPLRTFAHATGLEVGARGRIPTRIHTAFEQWRSEYAGIKMAGTAPYLRTLDCEDHLRTHTPVVITRRPMPFSEHSWDVRTESGFLLGHLPGPNEGKPGPAFALAASIDDGHALTGVIVDTGARRTVNGNTVTDPHHLTVPAGIRLQHAVFTSTDGARTLGVNDPYAETYLTEADVDELLPPRANIPTSHYTLLSRMRSLLTTDDVNYLRSWPGFTLRFTWTAQSAGTGPWCTYVRNARDPRITKQGALWFRAPAMNARIDLTGITPY